MALFRGIQEYIALDANNITLVSDSGNIVNISGNIFLYPPQGHPILYNYQNLIMLMPTSLSRSIVLTILKCESLMDMDKRNKCKENHTNRYILSAGKIYNHAW